MTDVVHVVAGFARSGAAGAAVLEMMMNESLVRALVGCMSVGAIAGACSAATNDGTTTGRGTQSGAGGNGTGGDLTVATTGAGGGLSTTGGGGSDGCASATSEAEPGIAPADIVFVVDNSGSMGEEASLVQASMNAFANTIINSGIDVRVILISADSNDSEGICVPAPLGSGSCPNDENLPVFQHVDQVVSSSDALQQIISTFPQWQATLRPNATKTLAVVSDDDSAINAATFTQQLLALDPQFQGFKFSAIVAPYELSSPFVCFNCQANNCAQCDPCCGQNSAPFPACIDLPADEGKVYKDLVSQTGGVLGDLCTQNFQPVFDDMAQSVVTGSQIACIYDIPEPGNGQTIDFGKVNVEYRPDQQSPFTTIPFVSGGAGACDNTGGWYYDDAMNPTQILLCPSTCDAVQLGTEGGKLNVQFGCETIVK